MEMDDIQHTLLLVYHESTTFKNQYQCFFFNVKA